MSTIFFTKSMLASSERRGELDSLRQSGTRIGLLVNGNGHQPHLLEKMSGRRTRLRAVVERDLVIYADRFTDDVLAEAAARARKNTGQALFVGEYSQERSGALNAGFDAAIPHASLVSEVMEGETLVYARISGLDGDYHDGRMERLLKLPAVPVHVTTEENGSAYVITSTTIAELIRRMGFSVLTFDDHNPQTTDLYLVRDDRRVPERVDPTKYAIDFLAERNKAELVVAPVENAIMVALPADVSIEELHFPNPRHGHNWRLAPDCILWQPEDPATFKRRGDTIVPPVSTSPFTEMAGLTDKEVKELRNGITKDAIERLYSPYVGKTQLKVGGKSYEIKTRHTSREENKFVTDGLLEQLKLIGGDLLTVKPCPFDLRGGRTLSNVEADLPGADPSKIVIISAHLDSKATNAYGNYPAPGADDDASGMAGVLAAAEVVVKLRREVGPFKRTLRFILFNAEEDGVNGSLEYVRELPPNIDICGVFQMDMIGFHGGRPTVFEIHAGYKDAAIETRSRLLAERVRDVAAVVSKSIVNRGSPQIYPPSDGFDPSAGNSDHSRFHECGHAACMISEDYNWDTGDPYPDDPQDNKAYHTISDKTIDCAYAADIARAVAGAAIVTAKI
jgi:bacterial leucyl aminopeptidase